jgi:hypothetical protein
MNSQLQEALRVELKVDYSNTLTIFHAITEATLFRMEKGGQPTFTDFLLADLFLDPLNGRHC